MAKNWEKLSKEEKDAVIYQIQIQNELKKADIPYMCYWLKISLNEFWDIYLFNKLKSCSHKP